MLSHRNPNITGKAQAYKEKSRLVGILKVRERDEKTPHFMISL